MYYINCTQLRHIKKIAYLAANNLHNLKSNTTKTQCKDNIFFITTLLQNKYFAQ